MGTFFDKITSTYSSSGAEDTPEEERDEAPTPKRSKKQKKEPRNIIHPQREPKKPFMPNNRETHLKVDAEETDLQETAQEREEDGELTVDIYDKGDSIVIQSTVAGVKPEDLDISITTDSVTIRGKRKQMEEVRDEDYYYKELFWGAFSRSIILPEEIEEGEADANLKHGLLSIRLPKKKRNVVQKLKVKVT